MFTIYIVEFVIINTIEDEIEICSLSQTLFCKNTIYITK
jgi:hypothetical protein